MGGSQAEAVSFFVLELLRIGCLFVLELLLIGCLLLLV